MAVVDDTLDPPVAQVVRWNVAGTYPRVVDTSVLVQWWLLVPEGVLMPLPTGMCMECGRAKALSKSCVLGGGGAGRSLEGVVEGIPVLEGTAGSVRERHGKGFQRCKGLLQGSARRGVPALEGGFKQGSSQGFRRRKGFQQRFQPALYHLHSLFFQATVDVSGTSRWLSRRQEGTVQHLRWTQCPLRGGPATG